MSLEDLIQDAHLLFWRIRREAQPDMTDHKVFMGYFKVAYAHHIIDLANHRTELNEVTVSQIPMEGEDGEALDIWEIIGGMEFHTAEFHATLSRAPKAIADLLRLVGTEEGLRKLRRYKHRRWDPVTHKKLPTWETTNSMLCRVLGIDATTDFDLIGATKGFLRGG